MIERIYAKEVKKGDLIPWFEDGTIKEVVEIEVLSRGLIDHIKWTFKDGFEIEVTSGKLWTVYRK